MNTAGRAITAVLLLLAVAAALPASAQAPEGDAARLDREEARIGEQATLELDVFTPPGATVDIDPGSDAWGSVEVVRLVDQQVSREGDRERHRLRVLIAGFLLGEQSFEPAVNITLATDIEPRRLPPQRWQILPTLPADAPLELSPLDPPVAIGGAESAWLRPAIFAGIALAVIVLLVILRWVGRRVWGRFRRPAPAPAYQPLGPPLLADAEALMGPDPGRAYRELAAVVRKFLTRHYDFPAFALTTTELRRRMEREGVDRWQARLVAGLLEECDAVVYAGYRPAMERREADLNVAREIVGEP